MVTKIDEKNATMVTDAVDPAGKANGRADIGLLQGGTGVAAVTVHFEFLESRVPARETGLADRGKIGRKSAWHAGFVKHNSGKAGRSTP
jgi:hypothetical protein